MTAVDASAADADESFDLRRILRQPTWRDSGLTDGMSRPLRIQRAGLIYHVMSRGNNKMRIFLDDLDYARFVSILSDVRENYRLDLWLYCVMPTHYHAVFRTRCPNLSGAVRQLNGTYAQWWNRRHGHVGHVYQARFKAQIVEACTYLVRLCRYVLLNPVRAHLVSHPGGWRWSSYPALCGTASTCVDVPSLLTAIDPDTRLSLARLLEYVDDQGDEEMAALVRSDRRVIGSDEFARQFSAEARRASREVPARERRIGTPPLVTLLADALTRGAGLHGGIIDAFAAEYSIKEIAECAGLSARSVGRLVRANAAGAQRDTVVAAVESQP
ncbi:MAG TPA: transposase [Vicinamibacterales bacterium]|nr:transposase [Vicinamibacterales bacterium]